MNKIFEVGIDEVGRGSIFGPVFAAAVVLTEKNKSILKQFGVTDSKKLTPKITRLLLPKILLLSSDYGIGQSSAREIDKLGIRVATELSMIRALKKLKEKPSELIIDEELINSKHESKESSSNKKGKENDHDILNQSNAKEKNLITVDLTNEEKIVFSQLGINPLIKLGKEYLTSNNFVRLKESNKETEQPFDNKKTKAKQIKKISKSGEEKIQIAIEANTNSRDKSTNKTNENDEVELTDELNNARKKRRRSSASIE